jgi:hypothetical protein
VQLLLETTSSVQLVVLVVMTSICERYALLLLIVCVAFISPAVAELYRFGDGEEVDVNTPTRIGVCITGQIGRLELESKRRNVFAPLSNNSMVSVDVVFVLGNESTSVFVNGKADENQQKYVNAPQIKEFLRGTVRKVHVKWVEQPALPVLNPLYANNLGKMTKSNTKEFQQTRTRSHIRQWYNLRECYNSFVEMEYDHKQKYDAFIRLREDGFLVDRVNPFPVIPGKAALQPVGDSRKSEATVLDTSPRTPDVILSSCDSWGGYNDKGVVVGRAGAQSYFNGFMDAFYLFYDKLTHGKVVLHLYDIRKRYRYPNMELDPEIYTKAVLSHYNLSVLESTKDFPLIPSRLSEKSSFGRCFRIFLSAQFSYPCYIKNLPHRADFIKKGKCTY